jgi:Fe-S cluster assembly iron-binding protein IscA
MIRPGNHVAAARSWQFGKTAKGGEQIAVLFEILEGPDAGNSVTWFGYFTEKTVDRTIEALRYCGMEGDDLSAIRELPNKVQIVVEHETYEGKTRAKVAWVNQLGGGAIKLNNPMDDRELPNKVQIVVEHETYEGKTRAKVAWVNQLGGGAIKLNNPMDDRELKSFSARMRSAVARVPRVEGERAGAPQRPLDATPDDVQDDIPF